MHSAPGEYHGFLWFYFINEQVLRFLNLRYPRDYNTVPRLYFWLFHLLWLFPWSVYFPAVAKLSYKPVDRAGRTRLLALCWTGFVLVFFTFSTTQEYYSMPCYPALALLLGSAMAMEGDVDPARHTRALTAIAACAAVACHRYPGRWCGNVPDAGRYLQALSASIPGAYTLSLGHMEDLTLQSFAYLRLPLALAALSLLIGAIGTLRAAASARSWRRLSMMVLFFQAARLAMVVFDPYLSSRPLAEALLRAPDGELIVDHHYYTFSSVFFYTNRTALLLNGRFNNLVYGVVRARRAGCVHRRCEVPRPVAPPGTLLHCGDGRRCPASGGLVRSAQLNTVDSQRRQGVTGEPSVIALRFARVAVALLTS